MISHRNFRLIIVVIIQTAIFANPINLMLSDQNYIVYRTIKARSPLQLFQDNSSIDLTPPLITKPADFSYLVNTTGHNITWYIADKNPGNYSIQHNYQYIDTEMNKTWLENGTVSVSIDNLPIGTHLYTIIVEDSWGNRASDDVLVNVHQIANTPTFSLPENNPSSLSEMLLIVGLSILALLLVLIIGIGYRRRDIGQDLYANLPPEDALELELLTDKELF
ncbi:MAG: hypothetical protein ACFFE8_02990 [Candidatus Heimdallarchaeota archaeon]